MELYFVSRPTEPPAPVVASLPHSGVHVPARIANLFNARHREGLRNTDWFLPELYSFLPGLGVTMLAATHSRYVVDRNRDPDGGLHGNFAQTLIAKETAHGEPIYWSEQEPNALRARIGEYHAPFHQALRDLLDETMDRFGRALLLDLHSFMGPIANDFCVGDRHGTSCTAHTSGAFEVALRRQKFDVVRNQPFAGGHIVRAYARPPELEALQLEIRYSNYVDCSLIDQQRPELDLHRVADAQARLRPAFVQAIAAYTAGG